MKARERLALVARVKEAYKREGRKQGWGLAAVVAELEIDRAVRAALKAERDRLFRVGLLIQKDGEGLVGCCRDCQAEVEWGVVILCSDCGHARVTEGMDTDDTRTIQQWRKRG